MLLVFVVDRLGDIFRVSLTLHSITSGAMLGIFTLGMVVPWATSKGAITGGLLSMFFMLWIIVGAQVSMAQKKLVYPPLATSTEDCLNVGVSVNKTTTGTGYSPPSDDDKPFVLFTISFMYYALVGFVIVMVIGTIASLVSGANDPRTANRNHFPPIIQRYVEDTFAWNSPWKFEAFAGFVSDSCRRKSTRTCRCGRFRTRWSRIRRRKS